MLSICTPVYNYDARPLVLELLRQSESLEGEVEILAYDDGSEEACRVLNRELAAHPAVRYVELPTNLGRAAIRNRMAHDARYGTLILVDVDSWPNPDYLINYLQQPDAEVVVGGTTYSATAPADPALALHWNYGRKREALTPALRAPHPYLHFQSNNFRVHRPFFLAHPFPDVKGYGHEDTLWGQLLAPSSTKIAYIDNPVTHLGLETAEAFLRKQEQAVQSLRELRKAHPTLSTRLTKFADRYPIMVQLAELLPETTLRNHLLRTNNLRALDILKIKWWVSGWGLAIGYS